MLNFLLDILFYNYTPYKSFFFLLNISKKSLLIKVLISIIIALITNSYITVVYVIIVYFVYKIIPLNFKNLLSYYLFYLSVIILYYLINCSFNFDLNLILNIFIVNSLYILISYNLEKKS